jgi:menaquinol-cytochrome c reductase cytochrome b subunit
MFDWLDKRTGIKELVKNKLSYPIPVNANIWFCFGGLAFFLILLQVLTGVFMMFFYIPDAVKAQDSVKLICNEIPYGGLIRNIHRWGATLIIPFLFIHTVNVITRRAYKAPRELNWLSGMILIVFMFLFMGTGIILPWDWRSYWELIIWADWVGTIPIVGEHLKEPLILAFSIGKSFALHVWILPALTVLLLIFHLKMVRRHGIAEPL